MEQYKVNPGETLWGISQKKLGAGSRWKELGYTGDPTKLQPGTILNIPDITPTAIPPAPTIPPAPSPTIPPVAPSVPVTPPTAPVPAPTPAPEDILGQMEQRRKAEFQTYMDYLKGKESPLDVYKQYRAELGLPEKEEVVTGIQTQVQKTEDLLNNLEKDIQQRAGGFMVTAPMLRRQYATEGAPLREQYSQLLTGLGRAEAGLTGGRQQLGEMISMSQAEQERQRKIAETGFEYGQKVSPQEETALEIQRKQALAKAFPEEPKIERVGTPSTGVWERQADGSWKEVIKPEITKPATSADITEYQFAKTQGYTGTLQNWLDRKADVTPVTKNIITRYLANQGIPLTVATSKGELTTSALNKVVQALGGNLELAQTIWGEMQKGNDFEGIRQMMREAKLDLGLLDKFVQALQGTKSSGGITNPFD